MGIKIQYGSPGAMIVGGLAAGTATARREDEKERQKRLYDQLEKMQGLQNRPGSRYRQAMGGGEATTALSNKETSQPQGTWDDPLALATTAEAKVRIKSQRRANARAKRMGEQIPYPEAEMQPRQLSSINTPSLSSTTHNELDEATEHYIQSFGEESRTTIKEKMQHYAKALLVWKAAGYPTCSDEETAKRLAICESGKCGRYDVETKSCEVCGCRVNTSKWAVVNKARMATEDCPLGHWPKPSIVSTEIEK